MSYMLPYYAEALAMSLASLNSHIKTTKKQLPRVCEHKKCKSCKFYHKSKTEYAIYHCEKGHYVDKPISVACSLYEKRKSK